MDKIFYYAPTTGRLDNKTMNVHWEHTLPAYRNAPHVWNVGGQEIGRASCRERVLIAV